MSRFRLFIFGTLISASFYTTVLSPLLWAKPNSPRPNCLPKILQELDPVLKKRFEHAPELKWDEFSPEERILLRQQTDENPIVAIPETVKSRPAATQEILDHPEVRAFKERYKNQKDTRAHNDAFISTMKEPKPSWLFFHLENAVLKTMNDTIFMDKELVNAIQNRYVQLLMKNLEDNSILVKNLVRDAQYADYKTVRLIFTEDSRKVQKALQDIYKKTAIQFQTEISKLPLRELYKNRPRLESNPQAWFLAGMGKTSKQASVSARSTRDFVGSRKATPPVLGYAHITKHLRLRRDMADILRKNIQSSISETSGILSIIPGTTREYVLSPEAIELLRKTNPLSHSKRASLELLRAKFQRRFGTDLSERTLTTLQQYFEFVDEFSPSVYQTERILIDFEKAQHGLISIDISGQGARNLYQNMIALHKTTGESLVETLEATQKGFDTATKEMNNLTRHIKQTAVDVFGPGADQRVLISGDDVVFMPDKPISEAEKILFSQKLAQASEPSTYRTTFLPAEYSKFGENTGVIIPGEKRSSLIVNHELIEKNLRARIDGQIHYSKLKKMMFVIDPVIEDGGIIDIRLIVGGRVDAEALKMLRQALREVLPADYRINDVITPPAPASRPQGSAYLKFLLDAAA